MSTAGLPHGNKKLSPNALPKKWPNSAKIRQTSGTGCILAKHYFFSLEISR